MSQAGETAVPKSKSRKQRCAFATCRRKLNITNKFKCGVCALEFCGKHRYASEHGCSEAVARRERERLEQKLLSSKAAPDKLER